MDPENCQRKDWGKGDDWRIYLFSEVVLETLAQNLLADVFCENRRHFEGNLLLKKIVGMKSFIFKKDQKPQDLGCVVFYLSLQIDW